MPFKHFLTELPQTVLTLHIVIIQYKKLLLGCLIANSGAVIIDVDNAQRLFFASVASYVIDETDMLSFPLRQ